VDNKIAEIGYCLNRSYWGKGYGTEVAASLIEFGFKDLKMHRIVAMCDPKNIGSWKIMEKNGMTREGVLRENKIIRGNWRDSYIYSILEHEWQLD
jgi:RimJ/RimL family protein N-acetyltransferase